MALALEESVEENSDLQEEIEGVSFVYEKRIVSHLDDKIIDYHEKPQAGFSIRGTCADLGCDSCG